jgi:hypothetical protein
MNSVDISVIICSMLICSAFFPQLRLEYPPDKKANQIAIINMPADQMMGAVNCHHRLRLNEQTRVCVRRTEMDSAIWIKLLPKTSVTIRRIAGKAQIVALAESIYRQGQ